MNNSVFDSININALVTLTINNGTKISGRYLHAKDNVASFKSENGNVFHINKNDISIIEVVQENNHDESTTSDSSNFISYEDWEQIIYSEEQSMEDYKINTEHQNKIIQQLSSYEEIEQVINENISFDRSFAIKRYNELLGKHLFEINDLDEFCNFAKKYKPWIIKYPELEEIFFDKSEAFVELVTLTIKRTNSLIELNEIVAKYQGLIDLKVKLMKQQSLILNEIDSCKNLIKLEQIRRKLINSMWNDKIENFYNSRKNVILMEYK